MTIPEYLAVLRRRWLVVVLTTALFAAVAVAIVESATPRYEATAKVFVTPRPTKDAAAAMFAQSLLTQDRIQTYATLARNLNVMEAAATRLHVRQSPDALLKHVRATVPTNT